MPGTCNSEHSQPWRDVKWAAQVLGSSHPYYPVPQMSDMELQGLMLSLLGFGLALVSPFFIIFLFLPFWDANFILCHCILEVYNFLFDFTEAHS
jgi:predicted membrane metal-binding protein